MQVGEVSIGLGACCISTGGTVTKQDKAIAVEDPGRVGRGFEGEGWKRDTNDSEVGVSVSNPDRTKELFNIKHRVEHMTSSLKENASEAGNHTRSWFGDPVEAESGFCIHRRISSHSYW